VDGEVDPVLRVAVILPDLLGTYGDGGNAAVLAARARARGIEVEVVLLTIGTTIAPADLYLLGGGEDGPQRLARDLLVEGGFVERVHDGAHVFAVCAGLQILGTTFSIEGDASYPGLGLVEATTTRARTRAVGDMATMVSGHMMVGFENHGGVTTLGPGVEPFGQVLVGRGNDGHVDGYRVGPIWATYAHGPVLAQNPWLADQLLSEVTGETLAPWASVADRLYLERCERVSTRRSAGDHTAGRH
jgi:CobQ-like glutamine amidotransferase family enzyme